MANVHRVTCVVTRNLEFCAPLNSLLRHARGSQDPHQLGSFRDDICKCHRTWGRTLETEVPCHRGYGTQGNPHY